MTAGLTRPPALSAGLRQTIPEVRLIQNPGNQGKGYAVRNGILNARGKIILFTDADLSSSITEATKLFAALEKGADVAIGSRWLDPSLQFQRKPLKRQISAYPHFQPVYPGGADLSLP